MRILIALDRHSYSKYIIRQASELAKNTWADITLLGICGNGANGEKNLSTNNSVGIDDSEITRILDTYRKDFLSHFQDGDSPYGETASEYTLVQSDKDVFDLIYDGRSGRKNLNVRIRCGNAGKEILAESIKNETDLIVIGCDRGKGCKWVDDEGVQQTIVKNALCSVMVVKEDKKPQTIVCCLDHDKVSQSSMELINQLVTFYQAELEIVGVKEKDGLKSEIDRKMSQILKYYSDCNVRALVRLVDAHSLKTFVDEAAKKNLVVLWMGKESFLDKIFSRQRLAKLATTSESSILILR